MSNRHPVRGGIGKDIRGIPEEDGRLGASADRATDASHGAPDGSPPSGSVSTDAVQRSPSQLRVDAALARARHNTNTARALEEWADDIEAREPCGPSSAIVAAPYRNLGNRAVSTAHSIGLSCDHCRVAWTGCAAECCCPECGAGKGYHEADYGVCYCDACRETGAA